jgi:hypothetical protein
MVFGVVIALIQVVGGFLVGREAEPEKAVDDSGERESLLSGVERESDEVLSLKEVVTSTDKKIRRGCKWCHEL